MHPVQWYGKLPVSVKWNSSRAVVRSIETIYVTISVMLKKSPESDSASSRETLQPPTLSYRRELRRMMTRLVLVGALFFTFPVSTGETAFSPDMAPAASPEETLPELYNQDGMVTTLEQMYASCQGSLACEILPITISGPEAGLKLIVHNPNSPGIVVDVTLQDIKMIMYPEGDEVPSQMVGIASASDENVLKQITRLVHLYYDLYFLKIA